MSGSFYICIHLHEMYMIRGSMVYMLENDLTMLKEQAQLLARSCEWFDKKCSSNEIINGWKANGDNIDEWIIALWFAMDVDPNLNASHKETLRRLAWWLDDVVASELPPETVHSSPMVVKAREVG